jgi:predicted SnoaL-like aldol condensation-catalyzing enzyme
MDSKAEVVSKFWRLFDEARFDDVADLLRPDCNVYWPNTHELFKGSQKLINMNKRYPGRWHIDIVDIITSDDLVVSVVRVYSEESEHSFYAASFFRFEKGLIAEITEYWGNITEPPAWRTAEGFSQRY